MKVYFAAPLFSNAERDYNLSLTTRLEKQGFEVFLPQRDGVESNKVPYTSMTKDERRRAMFNIDKERICNGDIFLFVLDGRVPDEGACVELGIAYADREARNIERCLVGLHTDSRAAFMGSKLNPMLLVPLDYVAEDENSLFDYLARIGKEST